VSRFGIGFERAEKTPPPDPSPRRGGGTGLLFAPSPLRGGGRGVGFVRKLLASCGQFWPGGPGGGESLDFSSSARHLAASSGLPQSSYRRTSRRRASPRRSCPAVPGVWAAGFFSASRFNPR